MDKVQASYKDLDGISEKLTAESTQGILDGFPESWGPQFLARSCDGLYQGGGL